MVLKLCRIVLIVLFGFESSVNSDGTQTLDNKSAQHGQFESSVNSDGTQTTGTTTSIFFMFESSVNSDGTQT